MKQQIAEQWVAALRSGKYKQGRGRLRSHDDSFCCLGVLCELHARENDCYHAQVGEDNTYYGYANSLPTEVVIWSGMKTVYGNFNHTTLAIINDNGYSFDQIADIIEKNYENL